MKGSPVQPQCGFSMRAVQVLGECGQRYAYVDILSHPEIRSTLPSVSDWPTFPQLFIAGELIGGSDIIAEMHDSGELAPLLASAVADSGAGAARGTAARLASPRGGGF